MSYEPWHCWFNHQFFSRHNRRVEPSVVHPLRVRQGREVPRRQTLRQGERQRCHAVLVRLQSRKEESRLREIHAGLAAAGRRACFRHLRGRFRLRGLVGPIGADGDIILPLHAAVAARGGAGHEHLSFSL